MPNGIISPQSNGNNYTISARIFVMYCWYYYIMDTYCYSRIFSAIDFFMYADYNY